MDTSIQKEKDVLSCSVCSEMLKEPRILPCQHRLCEGCLTSHIAVSTTRAVDGQLGFSCPECREFIPAPGTSDSTSTWATEFKTDRCPKLLTELHTCRQELAKNNEQPISHTCLQHTNTEVDLYCVDCSLTICHLCAAISHDNCNRLVTIKKAAEYLRSKVEENLFQAHSIVNNILKQIQVRESYRKEVHETVILVDKEIRELTQKVMEWLNYQHYELLKELRQHYDALLKNLEVNMSTLAEDIAQLMVDLRPATSYTGIELCSDTSLNAAMASFPSKCTAYYKQYDSLCKKLSATCRFKASSSPYASLGSILFISETGNTKGPDDRALSGSMPTQGSVSMQSGRKDTQGSLSVPIDLTVAMPSKSSMSMPSGTKDTQESLSTLIDLTVAMPTQESMSLSSGSQTLKSMQGPMSRSQTHSGKRGETSKFDRVRYRGIPETSADETFLPLKKKK